MSKTTYLDFLDAVKKYYGTSSDQWAEIATYGLKADNAYNILKQVPNVDIVKNANGSVRGIFYKDFQSMGGYSGGDTDKLNEILWGIDSNYLNSTANVKNATNLHIPSNTKVNETTGNLEMTSEIGKKVSTGQKVVGVLGNIGQAVLAVGTACTLGKTIDKALYNLNPDFWNAHDMSTLNPDTWASITNSGSLGDSIFNILMGIDPETNETTAYIDQNALAYMSWYLQSIDFFSTTEVAKVSNETINETFPFLNNYIESDLTANLSSLSISSGYDTVLNRPNTQIFKSDPSVYMFNIEYLNQKPYESKIFNCFNKSYKVGNRTYYDEPPYNTDEINLSNNYSLTFYYDNKAYTNYYGGADSELGNTTIKYDTPTIKLNVPSDFTVQSNSLTRYIIWLLANKSIITSSGNYEGVGNQPDATIPDLSNANSIEDVLNALKTSNPSLFDNAITNSVPQEDGSIKDYIYLPFTLPNTSNANDTEPETGNQMQGEPQVNPETSPDSLLDLISNLINNKLDTPNTPNKGEGSTPSTTTPTGTASALYKIYNPSQDELNSFGAWLWSSNFVDQLLKVFNNPMESIIGLHKVYASPVIGGQTNIKVGYLDSGVSSNWVSNQYTKIDCGTVNLQEYFGNVFDYAPYTNIELYLPCIGFVNLNVGDVMRSKMNITYTVDVLTGSCLAEISVNRDGGGGVLYSYSGNCASQYPLSSGSYMGIVSSAIGITGSIIGTVASGGSLTPLALGSVGSALNTHTSVQHSGSLSGNSGVMGGKIPYLIITRPQTNMPNNYEHLQGVPSNYYVQLSSCHGFTQVKNVNVQNINAENEELNQIKTLLMEGVLI